MTFRQEIREIYDSRTILRSLVVKNLIGQYKNSILGFAWHFVMPIVLMIVYYVVFTSVRINPIPDFWIYMSSGLFPFTFMLSNISTGAGCIVNNSSMVKKMYFPRSIIVIAQVISSFITMLIGYVIVLIAIALSGYCVSALYLLLPFILVLMLFFVLGYSLIFSALTVYSRDIQYLLNSLSIVFYFVTPIYFTTDGMAGLFDLVVSLNPFAYYVELIHRVVYEGVIPSMDLIVTCATMSVLSMIFGIIIFRKLRNGFVERL